MFVPTLHGPGGGVSTPVVVEIGGVRLALEAASADVCLELSPSRRLFACAVDGEPDVSIVVARRDLGRRHPIGQRLSRSPRAGERWEVWESHGERVFWLSAPELGRAPSTMARFAPDFGRGEISLHDRYFPEGEAVDPLAHALDELILMHWLAQGRGMELHASGVIDDDGRGYLFVGPTGAGKTTLSRLWLEHGGRAAVVISDDRVILRRQGSDLWMYGTPWHGDAELSAARRAPVAAVFLLDKAPRTSAAIIPRKEAAAALLASALVPFYTSGALKRTSHMVDEVVAEIPCARLKFARNADFVKIVRSRAG